MAHSSPNISLDSSEIKASTNAQSTLATNGKNADSLLNDGDSLHHKPGSDLSSELSENPVADSKNTTIDSNVLNDIGNMLANLTDELDAMLEEEKRVGLNDSE